MKANTLRLSINIFLSLCCLALLLLILWQYFFKQQVNDQIGIQLVQSSIITNENLNWRWFGSSGIGAEQNARMQDEAQEQLAEASINAVLLGVLRTQDSATATISVNGQQEKVFTIGEELLPGVELLSVSTSRVILNERGRQVQISMPKPEDMLIQVPNQRGNQMGAGSTGLLRDGFSLANMFDALPVQLDNSATGIQLGGISDEMLSLSELQDGDVVMQIGGSSIDELMANPAQWMSYSTETTLPVTVMRDGQETTLFVNAFSLSARILPNLTSELMQ
jgi:type II secretory pathway component PulC